MNKENLKFRKNTQCNFLLHLTNQKKDKVAVCSLTTTAMIQAIKYI